MIRSLNTTVLLALPIWCSVFIFATVHQSVLVSITLILSILSIYLLHEQNKPLPKIILFPSICVLFTMIFSIIPLPVSWGNSLLGGHQDLRLMGLDVISAEFQPLAFRPKAACIWIAFLCSCALYGWACGSRFTHVRRFKLLAHQIIYCALVLCCIAWLQHLSSAPSIYWISDIPSYKREYFFGSFVNPNHAGAFLAATLPLALSMRGNKKYIFSVLLALGLWTTQSRGAVIAGMISMGIYSLYMFRTHMRWLSLGIIISALLASLQLDFFRRK